jgi:trans-feruloyl-CoA hydratase/vanillin synthase
MTGETFTGAQAAAMRLVNESVPRATLRARTVALAQTLMGKNPHVLNAIKLAYRRVKDMNWDVAEDYLYAKAQQSYSTDPERGRAAGMKQFLDDKTYRPGLGNYTRDKQD